MVSVGLTRYSPAGGAIVRLISIANFNYRRVELFCSSMRILRRRRMAILQEIEQRDLKTLAGIVQGPGAYATPSPDRVNRLMQHGLIKTKGGTLRPTLKGRIVAWLWRLRH